ncbi:MAG: DUF4389 domain-containing protein [Alphaproteobacteria bacterium]|nr:MAG: DUF4389 domain-containing protein [Alphaproteobacteria bacterium]
MRIRKEKTMAEETPNSAEKNESESAEKKAEEKKAAGKKTGTTKSRSASSAKKSTTAPKKTTSATKKATTGAHRNSASSRRKATAKAEASPSGKATSEKAVGAGTTGMAPSSSENRKDERERKMRNEGHAEGLLDPGRLIPLAWRLGGLLVFGFVAYMILMILYLLGALQFLVIVLRGEGNDELARVMDWLVAWLRQIVDYFAGRTPAREMPFPFTPLPLRSDED